MKKLMLAISGLLAIFTTAVIAGESAAPRDAHLYIGWPNDGEIIKSGTFRVWFGLRNAGVAPAGVKHPNTGHHHLLVNTELSPFDQEVPSDKKHLHFGGGQTEGRLELPAGRHTLQLLFGDHEHVPHNPPMFSNRITITVP